MNANQAGSLQQAMQQGGFIYDDITTLIQRLKNRRDELEAELSGVERKRQELSRLKAMIAAHDNYAEQAK